MHSGTRSYVTVYNYTQAEFEGLERGTNIHDSDFFEDVVPHILNWMILNTTRGISSYRSLARPSGMVQ
jgi:hypothetical protein